MNIIDFFDKSVQTIILDLLKKCIREFSSFNQWSSQMQECLTFLSNKCSYLDISQESILEKALDCLGLLISRLKN